MTHLAIDFVAALLAAPATSDDGMERSGGLPLFFVAFAMVCVAVSLYEALGSPATTTIIAVQSMLVPQL